MARLGGRRLAGEWGSRRQRRTADRDAEGVEGWGMKMGASLIPLFPLPNRLVGLGERRELAQRGPDGPAVADRRL